jgi:uncharacterized protein YecT (DUF1311 family)
MLAAGQACAFDCAQAKSRSEKALCADPAAKASDDAMSAAFAALKPQLDAAQAKALLTNQRAWLKNRDSRCAGQGADLKAAPSCLKGENESRVTALTAKPAAGPGLPGRLVPVFIARPGSKTAYQVDWMLYRFQAAASPAEIAFNKAVDRLMADAPKGCDEPGGGGTCSSDRTASVAYASPALLSVGISGYEFAGGAHGSQIDTVLNLDLKTGRVLTMDDLLPPARLADVSKICRPQLASQLKDKLKEGGEDPDTDTDAKASFADQLKQIADGSGDTIKDLSNWRFGATSATITFVQDSIAAHVYGAFDCAVPYASLKPIAKPGFPLP